MKSIIAAVHNYTSRRRRVARSVSWTTQYEADALPENATPAWTKSANPSTEEISPAGYLHLVSGNNGSGYQLVDENLVEAGATFETNMKVISGQANDYEGAFSNATSALGFTITGATGINGNLYIYNDAVVLEGIGDIVPGHYFVYSIDTSSYHTYRVTATVNTLTLYVDGIVRGTCTPASGGTGSVLFYPDVMGITGVETSWNYIYYRTDGAFAP